jgi:hypothetical protein
VLTRLAWRHLDLAPPNGVDSQIGLFDDEPGDDDRRR